MFIKTLSFLPLISDFIKIRHIEENLCRNDIQKKRKYFQKWGQLIIYFVTKQCI